MGCGFWKRQVVGQTPHISFWQHSQPRTEKVKQVCCSTELTWNVEQTSFTTFLLRLKALPTLLILQLKRQKLKKKKELAWCLGFGANILHVNCGLKRGAFGLAHQCNSCLTYSNCRHTTFRKKNQSLVSVLSDRKKKDLKQLALWKAFS